MNPSHIPQSAPVTVRFAGFESDTYTLQNSGWCLSIEQDSYKDTFCLAIEHRREKARYGAKRTIKAYIIEMAG